MVVLEVVMEVEKVGDGGGEGGDGGGRGGSSRKRRRIGSADGDRVMEMVVVTGKEKMLRRRY